MVFSSCFQRRTKWICVRAIQKTVFAFRVWIVKNRLPLIFYQTKLLECFGIFFVWHGMCGHLTSSTCARFSFRRCYTKCWRCQALIWKLIDCLSIIRWILIDCLNLSLLKNGCLQANLLRNVHTIRMATGNIIYVFHWLHEQQWRMAISF